MLILLEPRCTGNIYRQNLTVASNITLNMVWKTKGKILKVKQATNIS